MWIQPCLALATMLLAQAACSDGHCITVTNDDDRVRSVTLKVPHGELLLDGRIGPHQTRYVFYWPRIESGLELEVARDGLPPLQTNIGYFEQTYNFYPAGRAESVRFNADGFTRGVVRYCPF